MKNFGKNIALQLLPFMLSKHDMSREELIKLIETPINKEINRLNDERIKELKTSKELVSSLMEELLQYQYGHESTAMRFATTYLLRLKIKIALLIK